MLIPRHLRPMTDRATIATQVAPIEERDEEVSLEDAQYLAGHADPRTTRLYNRRRRKITRNIVERILITLE